MEIEEDIFAKWQNIINNIEVLEGTETMLQRLTDEFFEMLALTGNLDSNQTGH